MTRLLISELMWPFLPQLARCQAQAFQAIERGLSARKDSLEDHFAQLAAVDRLIRYLGAPRAGMRHPGGPPQRYLTSRRQRRIEWCRGNTGASAMSRRKTRSGMVFLRQPIAQSVKTDAAKLTDMREAITL